MSHSHNFYIHTPPPKRVHRCHTTLVNNVYKEIAFFKMAISIPAGGIGFESKTQRWTAISVSFLRRECLEKLTHRIAWSFRRSQVNTICSMMAMSIPVGGIGSGSEIQSWTAISECE